MRKSKKGEKIRGRDERREEGQKTAEDRKLACSCAHHLNVYSIVAK